jgi:YD repeat-containing protein
VARAEDSPNTLPPQTEYFVYEVTGNLIRETNGAGETTATTYNELGLPVIAWDGNGDATHYRYDTEGNLLAATRTSIATSATARRTSPTPRASARPATRWRTCRDSGRRPPA